MFIQSDNYFYLCERLSILGKFGLTKGETMATRTTLLTITISILAGCTAPGLPEEKDILLGPCYHDSDELINIEKARGTQTGVGISEVILSSFTVNGEERSVRDVTALRREHVSTHGDGLICVLPCGFGAEEGRWEFIAEAPGYSPTPQQYNATYTLRGGCPSRDMGIDVSINLDKKNKDE